MLDALLLIYIILNMAGLFIGLMDSLHSNQGYRFKVSHILFPAYLAGYLVVRIFVFILLELF